MLHFHRAQINSAEFLNGVRTVLKRDNVVEALSICDATPGPVARLVKTAVLSRDHGRERVREALEEAGLAEVPRLEERLGLLATIAQIGAVARPAGDAARLHQDFREDGARRLELPTSACSPSGVWEALVCAAAGLAVAIPAHAGYNYLVNRVNEIVLDMEKAATEIVNIVTESPGPQGTNEVSPQRQDVQGASRLRALCQRLFLPADFHPARLAGLHPRRPHRASGASDADCPARSGRR